MKSGREAVEQAEGEAKKDDDKEGTGRAPRRRAEEKEVD